MNRRTKGPLGPNFLNVIRTLWTTFGKNLSIYSRHKVIVSKWWLARQAGLIVSERKYLEKFSIQVTFDRDR